jgi:hypothetical protein
MEKILICNSCKKEFIENYPSSKRVFCSRKCFFESGFKSVNVFWDTASEKEKFERHKKNLFRHVNKDSENGCWNCTGYLNRGYGVTRYEGKDIIPAHRLSWILFKGEIPKGLWVLHKCDNKRCVNPEHLFLGTCKDNVKDMIKKHGNPKWGRKLIQWTENDKNEMIKLYNNSNSIYKISIKFCVSHETIKDFFVREGILK